MKRWFLGLVVLVVVSVVLGCGPAEVGSYYAVFNGDKIEMHMGGRVRTIPGVGLYAHTRGGEPTVLYAGEDGKVHLWRNGADKVVGDRPEAVFHLAVGPYDVVETHREAYVFYGSRGLIAKLGGVSAADDIAPSYAFASDGKYLYVRSNSGVACIDEDGDSVPVEGLNMPASEDMVLYDAGGYAAVVSEHYVFVLKACRVVESAGGPGNIRVVKYAAGAGYPAFLESPSGKVGVVLYLRNECCSFSSLWAVVLGDKRVSTLKVGEMPDTADQSAYLMSGYTDGTVALASLWVGVEPADIGERAGEFLAFWQIFGDRHYIDSHSYAVRGRYIYAEVNGDVVGPWYVMDDGRRVNYTHFGGSEVVPGYVIKDGVVFRLADKPGKIVENVEMDDIFVVSSFYEGREHAMFYTGGDTLRAFLSSGRVVEFPVKVQGFERLFTTGEHLPVGVVMVQRATQSEVVLLNLKRGLWDSFTSEGKPVHVEDPTLVAEFYKDNRTYVFSAQRSFSLDDWYYSVEQTEHAVLVVCGQCVGIPSSYGVAVFK